MEFPSRFAILQTEKGIFVYDLIVIKFLFDESGIEHVPQLFRFSF